VRKVRGMSRDDVDSFLLTLGSRRYYVGIESKEKVRHTRWELLGYEAPIPKRGPNHE
jgi:hypothetical protein